VFRWVEIESDDIVELLRSGGHWRA
jgi:hypothetical protein